MTPHTRLQDVSLSEHMRGKQVCVNGHVFADGHNNGPQQQVIGSQTLRRFVSRMECLHNVFVRFGETVRLSAFNQGRFLTRPFFRRRFLEDVAFCGTGGAPRCATPAPQHNMYGGLFLSYSKHTFLRLR